MRRFTATTCMVALLATSFPLSVFAQDDATAKIESLSEEAGEAYRDGEYEKAIALFEEAYAIQPIPNLLFNIARVYEKLENWAQAEKYYREFIKSPEAEASAREAALERVDSLKQLQQVASQPETPPEPDVPAEPEEPAVVAQPTQPPPKKSSPLPWILIGTGGGLALTGGVFGILAAGKQSTFNNATTAEEKLSARKSGKTFALVADIGYGLGIASAAVGVVLLLTGSSESASSEQALRIVPSGSVDADGQPHVGFSFRF